MTDKPTPWGSVAAQFTPEDTPEYKARVRRQYLQYLTTKPFDSKDIEEQKDLLRSSRMDQIRSQIAANPDLRMTTEQGGAYETVKAKRNPLLAVHGGLSTNIFGAAGNRLSGGGAETFVPEGIPEGLLYGGAALAGSVPEFAALMMALPAVAAASPAAIPAWLGSKAKTAHAVYNALSKAGRAAHAVPGGSAVLSNPISRMATIGGVHGAANEAIAGSLNRGAVDPLEILRRGGVGAATMGAGKAANVGARMLAGGPAVRALPVSEIAESLTKVGGGSRLAGNLAEIGTMGIGGHVIDTTLHGRPEWPTWEQSLVAAGPLLAPMAIGAVGARGARRAAQQKQEAALQETALQEALQEAGQPRVQQGEVWPLINPEKGMAPGRAAETLALRRNKVMAQLDGLPTSKEEMARLKPKDRARVVAQANALEDRLALLDKALLRVNARGEQNADWQRQATMERFQGANRVVTPEIPPGTSAIPDPLLSVSLTRVDQAIARVLEKGRAQGLNAGDLATLRDLKQQKQQIRAAIEGSGPVANPFKPPSAEVSRGTPTMRRPPPRIPGTVDPVAAAAAEWRQRNIIRQAFGGVPEPFPVEVIPEPSFLFDPVPTFMSPQSQGSVRVAIPEPSPGSVGPPPRGVALRPGDLEALRAGQQQRAAAAAQAKAAAKPQAKTGPSPIGARLAPGTAVEIKIDGKKKAGIVRNDPGGDAVTVEYSGITAPVPRKFVRPTSGVAEPAAAPAQGGPTAFLEEGGPLSMMGGGDASAKGQAPRPFDPTMAAPGGGGAGNIHAELRPAEIESIGYKALAEARAFSGIDIPPPQHGLPGTLSWLIRTRENILDAGSSIRKSGDLQKGIALSAQVRDVLNPVIRDIETSYARREMNELPPLIKEAEANVKRLKNEIAQERDPETIESLKEELTAARDDALSYKEALKDARAIAAGAAPRSYLEEGGPLSMMGGGDASVKGHRPFDPTMAAPGSGSGVGSMAGTPAELRPAAPKGGVVVPPGAAPARPEVERAITTPYKVDPKTGREHYAFINWGKQNMPAEYHDSIVPILAQTIQETGRYPKQRKSSGEHLAEEAGVSPKMIDEIFLEPHKTVDAAVLGAMKKLLNQMSGDRRAAVTRLETQGNRMTAPEREALGAKIDQLKDAISRNFDFISKTKTEYGRNLYFQRLTAGQTWDVDYWLGQARRASGGALRDQDSQAVQKIVADGRAFEAEAARLDAEGNITGAARARKGVDEARRRMAQTQANLDRQTPWSIVTGLYRAGLLSGPKTSARNIVGNAAFQLAEEASRVPAVMADMLMERTGMGAGRTVAAPSGVAMQRSLREAIGGWDESGRWQSSEALRSLGRALRDGEVPQGFAKGLELTEPGQLKFSSEALFGTRVAPILDRYVNTVFGALKGQDQVFNAYALRRSLEEQARVQGINMKLGVEELEAHVQRVAAKPTAEMQANAIAYAEFATFNNDNMVSTEITRARQGLRSQGNLGRALAMGTEFIMPFNKTPTNIISRLLDYAVVGNLAKGLMSERSGKAFTALHRGEAGKRWQEFRAEAMKKLSPQEQKAIADAVGRGTIGVATIALGYFLASRGEMTGTYQGQAGDRGREQLLDRPASAIKLGGQWNVIGSMSPVGNLMALGATIYRDRTKLQGLGLAIPIMAIKTALDQPFLQGVEGVDDLVNSENFGQAASKGAGKFVQSWMPRIAQDVTDIEEGIRSGGVVPRREAMGAMQGLQAGFPGWREGLPSKIDPFGQPVQGSVWGAINPMLSRPAREDVDLLANEISRLDDVLRQATGKGLGISPPAKRRKGEEIPPDVYRATARTAGDRARRDLLRVIRSGAYRRNDPEGQAKMLRDSIEDARKAAK